MGASVSSIISQTPLPIPAPLQSATPNLFSSSIHFFKPAPKETTMQRAFLSHNPVPKTQQILHRFRKLDAGCFPSECLWVHDVMETEESKICRIFGYYRGEDLESIDEEANKAISERCLRMFVNSVIRRRVRKLERGRVLVRNEPSLAPRAAFDPARCTSNGNMKLLEDLVLAAPEGVLVNADSEFYANNIQNIVSAARIPGKKFNVLRRINLDVDPQVDIFLDAAVLLVNYIDQIWDQGFETDYLNIEGQLEIDHQSGAILPTDLIEVVRELVLTRDLNLIIEPGRSPTADTCLVNPITETNGTKKPIVMVGSVSELICPRLYVAYQVGKRDSFLFTSESVTEGHPDKLCDQISDKVVDACLEQDPNSKVTCETWTKNNIVVVVGKITTKANVDYEKLIRDTCRDVGYVSDDVGLDADRCKVLLNIEQQSPDIAQGIHGHLTKHPEKIGAGDQGHMFGYATDETPERMPLSHVLATKLGVRLTDVRKNGTCPWLGPDGKTQVTIEYFNDNGSMVPIRVHTVVISTQHDETVTKDEIEAGLMEHVIKHVIPQKFLDEKTIFHLNPSGRFVIGGPRGDAGLTGRKIIVDTYGGWGSHGGGAFSGKDPTRLDRSGAYLCRQVAKSIVDNRLARRCSVQVSYVPGVPEPSSLFVDTYGTGKIPDMEILKIVKENFDFRPGMIAINLDLKRGGNGRFSKTAAYGHFGRDDPDFTWEVVKLLKMGETPAVKFLQFK